MFPPPAQPRQVFYLPLPVPNLHMVQVQPRFYPRTDQTTIHRIRVPLDVDQTARVPLHPLPFGRLHPPCQQLSHERTVLRVEFLMTVARSRVTPQDFSLPVPGYSRRRNPRTV